jgi:cyclohexanecarboxylate-CoA ligase
MRAANPALADFSRGREGWHVLPNHIPREERERYRAAGLWRDAVLTDALDEHRRRRPDKVAIVERRRDGGTTTLTFAELAERADRIASGLAAAGVGAGDVVSLQLPNWWEFTAVYLACVRLGAVCNPIMPIFRHHEVRGILGRTGSRVLVIPDTFRRFDFQAMVADLRPDLPALETVFVVGDDVRPPHRPFRELWEGPSRTGSWPRPDPDRVTQLLFTSGTTGRPKGVLHSHNTLLAPVFASAARLRMGEADVIFMASPFAHQTGFEYGMAQGVLLGATTVYLDQWDPALAWDLMAEHGVTYTMAATPFLMETVREAARRGASLPTLRYFVSAGAPIPRAAVEEAAVRLPGTRVLAGWGMTENGLVTMNGPDDPPEKVYTTDGSPQPGMEVAVHDENGRPVPPGVEGHLKVRGSQNLVAYLGEDEATFRTAFDGDGWFRTWDLAVMDRDGFIRITGRAKDVINRGGEKVPVAEVEELVYRHPKVREAALVAMPHPRLGETSCLYVVAQEGEPPTLGEIVAHLRAAGLTPQFLPERLEVVPSLPRTPSGKIQKYLLREDIARKVAAERAS